MTNRCSSNLRAKRSLSSTTDVENLAADFVVPVSVDGNDKELRNLETVGSRV
jgi:hypothetical protein